MGQVPVVVSGFRSDAVDSRAAVVGPTKFPGVVCN
jgi:hypothetical protein